MRETIDFARRHGAADVEAYACCNAAHHHWEVGGLTRAAELLDRAQEVHPGGDRKFELIYLNALAHLSLARGEVDEARTLFRRALDSDRSIGDRHSRIPSLLGLSLLPATEQGRPRDSYLREVLDIVASTDDSLTRIRALVQLAALDLGRQDFSEAERRLELAVTEAANLEHRQVSMLAHAWLAAAQAGLGEMSLALETLTRAENILEDSLAADSPSPVSVDADLLDDLGYFRSLVALFATDDAPGSEQIRTLVDDLRERAKAHRFKPAARIWLWRNYPHLDDLADVIEASAEHVQVLDPARHLRISTDGSQFAPPGAQPLVDLSSRTSLKLILSKLAHLRVQSPGEGLSVSQLVAVGWPDDIVTKDAGRSRVYTAVRTLRSQGLADILITGQHGYMLDPDVSFAWL
jgi:tetratricopeptide (TPR) repeat protein